MKRIVTVFLFLFSLLTAFAQDIVYVSVQGDNKISVYSQNTTDGSLTKVEDVAVSGGPASIAISRNKKYLYVSQRSNKTFSSYSINQTTGALTLINTITALDNPVNIATDNTGEYLLSAYYGASKAAVYKINTVTGALIAGALSSFTTAGINPHAIKVDPSNQYVFISNMTGNRIQQFTFDVNTGTLTANTPAVIIPTDSIGPRHFVYHGTKNLVYFSNEILNRVSVYSLNTSTGLLTLQQELSTLPNGYVQTTGVDKAADIHITADNKFLYVSNRGTNTLAAFSVDATTGLLTAIDYFATQTSPRAFDIDGSGSFVYAAGESTGNMDCFSINKTTGALNLIATYPVGSNPSWVRCLSFTQTPTIVCLDLISIAISSLPTTDTYSLVLYNQSGTTQIKVLAEGIFNAGDSNFCFHKGSLPPATYQYRLLSGATIIKQGEVVIN